MTISTTPTTIGNITARNASLGQLADLLTGQHSRRLDIVAGAQSIRAEHGRLIIAGSEPLLTPDGVTSADGTYLPTEVCDEGIAGKLGIPLTYLRKMRAEFPHLYDTNVNGWLSRDGRKFLVRCLRDADGGTGVARALLSNRYAIVDNLDILTAALDGIHRSGVQVSDVTCDLTDRRMYLRVRCDAVAVMAPALLAGYRSPFSGQTGTDNPLVSAGFLISNSEVGAGAFTITPRLVIQVCNNGLTVAKDAQRAVHVGARQEEGVIEWSEETVRNTLALVTSRTADAVAAFTNAGYAETVLREVETKAGKPVTNADETIKTVSSRLRYTEEQRQTVLAHFFAGGSYTAGGVMGAVTSAAQTLTSADAAYGMEATALEALTIAASL